MIQNFVPLSEKLRTLIASEAALTDFIDALRGVGSGLPTPPLINAIGT